MKIFIQIASYRDPELLPTIKSCLENAKYPENLVFGICRQYHSDDKFDDLSKFEKDDRFKILNIPHQESKGVCWARNQVQQLYNEEEYTLQIDSHMRFEKDWDKILIGMIKQLQDIGIPKPLLTGYVSSYDPNNDPEGRVRVPWQMAFDKFIPEGAVFFLPETIPNWEDIDLPVPARFYSAHFCFTLGCFAKEVQHNPDFYFHGEEISITVRSFTHGYDLFHPHRVVLWHEYTRNGRVKQWDDDKEWWKLNEKSHLLNRKLFGMDGELQEGHDGKYGLGNVRTLRDYEKYAGILFEKRAVQDYTLQKNYPPNPDYITDQEWLNSFTKNFTHCINLDFNEFKEDDYDFWAITFHDENGNEIYRKDCTEQEIKNYLSVKFINICRNFLVTNNPKSWSVWVHSKSKEWVKQYTGII
jgi:glycosyltransferase involved in cell wall biosynthesis